jgi:hypothetical protein
MASRAHVIHDYSVPGPRARTHRQVWDRNDPVVLPRSSVWSAGAGVIAAALTIGAIVAASAFAGYHTDTPALSETPALLLADHWQPDSFVEQAHVTNLLAGPARAVPSLAAPNSSARLDDEPLVSSPAHEMIIDDPTPGVQGQRPGVASRSPLVPDKPGVVAPPYPNPTTTPPEAIAPPNASPQTPTPALDPENPYPD